jgi:uncharacterized protein
MPSPLRLASLALLLAAPVLAGPSHRDGSWVADEAHLLSAEELSAIEGFARTVEEKRGVRLAVVTLATSGGREPKAIAVDTLNEWRVGKESVLLLVVMDPRKLYLQPGTNYATRFDEATASGICRDTVAPAMREGRAGAAILAGLQAIDARLATPADPPSSASSVVGFLPIAGAGGFLGLFLLFVWMVRRKRGGSTSDSTSAGSSFYDSSHSSWDSGSSSDSSSSDGGGGGGSDF